MISEIKVDVLGAEDAEKRLDTVGDLIRLKLEETLMQIGRQVRETAEGLAPKRSGDMADSIREHLKEARGLMTESISVRAPGKWVEFGTVSHLEGGSDHVKKSMREALRAHGAWRTQPQPFLRPALHSVYSFVERVLLQAVQDIIKGDS